MNPWFFVTFNIISHIFPEIPQYVQKIRRFFPSILTNLNVAISAGVIVSYHVIIGLSRENRLSKYVMLLGNVVYTVV